MSLRILFAIITLSYLQIVAGCCIYGNELPSQPPCNIKLLLPQDIETHPDLNSATVWIDPGHIKYLLDFQELPKDEELVFSIRRLVQDYPQIFQEEFRFHLKDNLIITEGEKRLPFHCISSRSFLPGEKITCRIQSLSGKFRAEISFIPKPLIARSKTSPDFCLEAELMILRPAFYELHLTGLRENEEVTLRSTSEKEVIEYPFRKYFLSYGI